MKITKRKLKRIIKEEREKLLRESPDYPLDPELYDGFYSAITKLVYDEALYTGLDLTLPEVAHTVSTALKQVGEDIKEDAEQVQPTHHPGSEY